MASRRKRQDPPGTKAGFIEMIHFFLSQSGFVGTKYRPHLCVIKPTAIWRRSYRIAECQPIRVATERGHYPNIIDAGPVIDFGPVGGEAVQNFIGTVVGKL